MNRLLAGLLWSWACGCGVLTVEGDRCNINTECPNPDGDLTCFYGACHRTCLEDSVCGKGQRCSCGAG